MKKRKKIKLTEPEKETLLEMYRNHSKSRMKERAHMVLLSNDGYPIKEICSIVYRSENTVITWLNAYKSEGFLGLYDEPILGRPPKLDDNQQDQVTAWLDASPRKEGYQQSNWTLKLVAHHILLEFRTPFCLSRIWGMVHELGFTLIRPRHKSIVPTKEQIIQAFGKISANLERAMSGETRFFYLDETVATMWSTLCYCWARKGTRPEIPMADDHGRLYVFSAADPLRGKVHYHIAPSHSKEHLLAFLSQMRRYYPTDRLVFLLDNSKPHIAQKVNQFVISDGNMHLDYLPRYTSLKCNPIERLFKWFRRVVTHNQFFESITALKNAIRAFFRSVANQPKRIVSLLRLNLNSLLKIL
jgi:transposase